MNIIGYFHGIDPAACLLSDGEVVAYVEEERLVRVKHATGMFPIRSIAYCLDEAGLTLSDIDCFAYGWNADAYSDGTMAKFYATVNRIHPPDEETRAWQRRNLALFSRDRLQHTLQRQLMTHFGAGSTPELRFYPHHRAHAVTAFHCSPFNQALVLTIDGSGDQHCAVVWHGDGLELRPLHETFIPNSLGWFYAAITEYLGFEAYDGEYKVMGLAAYGRENPRLREALGNVVSPGPQGWDFIVDPHFIHHGAHSFSDRFTDALVAVLDVPPRLGPDPIEPVHEDLAYEAQRVLEQHVLRLVSHFRDRTGLSNLCIAGGVGLNVKMNSRLHYSGLFENVFAFPIPSDSGTAVGAAAGVFQNVTGARVQPVEHLYWGPAYDDADIERQLRSCGLDYRVCEDIAEETAELLAQGQVVAWFQGRMEGGPRALGGRSILADPRDQQSRDRVNAAVKFREYWRPFCPSLTEQAARRYLCKPKSAPFMIMAFEATAAAVEQVPAVVHVDGTVRVQTVGERTSPTYYRLLEAFERRTGVPVLLNTSFNIQGEAIVCTPRDALRTFWSTGIDALAIGRFLMMKPRSPRPFFPVDDTRVTRSETTAGSNR